MYTTENTTGYNDTQLEMLNEDLAAYLADNEGGHVSESELEKIHSDLVTNGMDERIIAGQNRKIRDHKKKHRR